MVTNRVFPHGHNWLNTLPSYLNAHALMSQQHMLQTKDKKNGGANKDAREYAIPWARTHLYKC